MYHRIESRRWKGIADCNNILFVSYEPALHCGDGMSRVTYREVIFSYLIGVVPQKLST